MARLAGEAVGDVSRSSSVARGGNSAFAGLTSMLRRACTSPSRISHVSTVHFIRLVTIRIRDVVLIPIRRGALILAATPLRPFRPKEVIQLCNEVGLAHT
jgi:hypothetical protein